MPKKIAIGLIVMIVLLLNALRFWKLDTIPNGYHVDEVGSAVTVQCFTERGCDAELLPWPLYGFMEYGQDKPPTYVYPGIIWGEIFGTTVPSLRGYAAFVLLIGILGLFFVARNLFGNAFAAVVVLAAACSPWAWVVTRVALESYFAPVFVIGGLYFFWRSSHWRDWALSGFLFACAMITYPPAMLQVPLMMITLAIYEWGRRPFRWQSILSLVIVFILSLLFTIFRHIHFSGSARIAQRFGDISIFNSNYLHSLGKSGSLGDIIGVFVHNYLLHLSPDFLFLTGDPSFVHSTRHLGLFSFLDITALFMLTVFLVIAIVNRSWKQNPVIKDRRWLIFLAANFFIGIIPSALTNQELPHALRICGGWPFMMLFTGFMLFSAAESLKPCWIAIALIGALSGGVLAYQYFTVYPQESKGMFDYWVKDTAEQLQTKEDWQKFMLYFHRRNYHIRYFLVHRLGLTCKQANDLWWQLHDQLDKQGQF